MSYSEASLHNVDPAIAALIDSEHYRQANTLLLIPSENYASRAVIQALGTEMTNKYAEGYPGKRYYNGCANYDEIENIAIERLTKLFGCEHANVQPHTGASANLAAYYALLNPGDTILGMSTAAGGHLTHGHKMNFSGHWFNMVNYTVNPETLYLDYDEILTLAKEHKPKMIICGASAYPRTIDFTKFRAIADEIGAYLLADISHIAGLVATGLHPSPVPYADIVTSTTHKTLRGPRGAIIMCRENLAAAVDKAIFPGVQAGPIMNIVAAKAVAFHEALQPEFTTYQQQVLKNAAVLAETLTAAGFSLTTGGTDNHLMLVDLTDKNITGRDAANALEAAGIVINKNGIPFDPKSPMVTSGIRPGTPAATTRGMKEEQMKTIARWITDIILNPADETIRTQVAAEVAEICRQFPVYQKTGLQKD